MWVAIDTGGTFTDLVAADETGALVRLKTPSTPDDPSRAIITALHELVASNDAQRGHAKAPTELKHGTTVGTNALLERRGARVGLIVTAGFEDVLMLGRQDRPELYALHPTVPPPLVPAARTFGVRGRLDATGAQIEALEDPDGFVTRHHEALAQCDALAICLLHAYASPQHEQAIAAAIAEHFPEVPLTVSHALAPLSREYERTSTVAVNAYLAPVMTAYLQKLCAGVDPTPVSVMLSGGGLAPATRCAAEPVRAVLSGPAGGVRGAWQAGQRCHKERLLGLDMGGTSADISLVLGELEPEDHGNLNEHALRTPLLPIVTIGAGGGSIAHIDAGGALFVGPRSAGAVPGPAAYGHAGPNAEPTVTDANVVLGRITELLGGAMAIHRDEAERAVARLADQLGASTEETATAIIGVAESNMARACKRVSMERGVDPRTLTLVPFGGAGGLHACALADELGCPDVLFPNEPGVLSAEGILGAPAQTAVTRSMHVVLRETTELGATIAELRDQSGRELQRESGRPAVSIQLLADCRYLGQTYTLAIDVSDDPNASELITRFVTLHRERYGYALAGAEVEWVTLRAFARGETSVETTAAHNDSTPSDSPPRDSPPKTWMGPQTISSYSATLWLPAGWQAERRPTGDIMCTRAGVETSGVGNKSALIGVQEALALEIHRQRIGSVAEEMGAALMRASFSANIKERRDFSCAVFDGDGRMLAQAAHIPVHLGSQQLSVEAAIAAHPMRRGDTVILNDPFTGGTHLPDVTVVAPVFLNDHDETPAYYVANRAHHADIGGIAPGSMPSAFNAAGEKRSLTIDDEGWRSPPVLLTNAVRDDFANTSRTPQERYGDLRAQEAANHVGQTRLVEMASDLHPRLNEVLLNYTERRMEAVIESLPDGSYAFQDELDADGRLVLPVTLTIAGKNARVDFSRAPDAVATSLNAVRAITVSAVFYCFRCLAGEEMPSNAGLLRPIEIITRRGSICDAEAPAAVSAGNVETSQRLVDIVYGALARAAPERIPAASGGTMNNILFGGELPAPFVHYETLAVGAGGGSAGPGANAVHTHMTNTLNTPCEELERIFPVHIERYAVRRGSGGAGTHPGGDGVVREYRFETAAHVTLMTERRTSAPWGLAGGEPGKRGENSVRRANGEEEPLGGQAAFEVNAGDTVVIKTPGGGGWGGS